MTNAALRRLLRELRSPGEQWTDLGTGVEVRRVRSFPRDRWEFVRDVRVGPDGSIGGGPRYA